MALQRSNCLNAFFACLFLLAGLFGLDYSSSMKAAFAVTFSDLRAIAEPYAETLGVKTDQPTEYALAGKKPSPFPQHKGAPLDFVYIRAGKSYVSFHLLPLYGAEITISSELKRRKQGKTCFNFISAPDSKLRLELQRLTEQCFRSWRGLGWL